MRTNMATAHLDSSDSDTTLLFVREKGWLNRFCQDDNTQKTLYYCESKPDSSFTVHRGDKEGPIIATGVACLTTPGDTDVHLTESNTTLHLEHVHHKRTTSTGKFSYNGGRYHWHGREELLDDEYGRVLAQFVHIGQKDDFDREHVYGKLIVKPHGQHFMDMVVITSLVMEERSPEGRHATRMGRIEAGLQEA